MKILSSDDIITSVVLREEEKSIGHSPSAWHALNILCHLKSLMNLHKVELRGNCVLSSTIRSMTGNRKGKNWTATPKTSGSVLRQKKTSEEKSENGYCSF